jgi:hypothetical protein
MFAEDLLDEPLDSRDGGRNGESLFQDSAW